MKVTIVLNTSWNLYNFRLGLIDALQQEGYVVTLIAPEDEYSDKLRELGYDFIPVAMDRRGINPGRDLAFFFRLYRIYRLIQPDLTLHFTVKPNIYGTLAAHLLGIKMINTVSGLGTVFLKQGLSSRIAQILYRGAFRWPQSVFFHNQDDHRLFVSRGLVAEPKAKVVPGSGIDPEQFAPAVPSSTVPSEEKPFTFLVIARLLYDKGIVEYAEAAQLLRQWGIRARFQLLGARDPRHRRGIPDAQVNVWIAEQLIDYQGVTDDVRSFIRQADAVVLPSYREGLPRTLLEAASMARPIITTDTPGCRHVVKDGYNGLLCRVRDAADLARQMQRLTEMPADARWAMGQAGRKLISEHFSEDRVVAQYLSTTERLLRTKKQVSFG